LYKKIDSEQRKREINIWQKNQYLIVTHSKKIDNLIKKTSWQFGIFRLKKCCSSHIGKLECNTNPKIESVIKTSMGKNNALVHTYIKHQT
jgi:hypothetical protein